MSLIKCPECGHEISSYADMCIYCGCPMTIIKRTINKKIEKKKDKEPASFKESLSNEQIETLNKLTKEITTSFPEFEGRLYSHYYGLKRNNDDFFSFVITREKNKVVLKYKKVFTKNEKETVSATNPFDHYAPVKNMIVAVIKSNESKKAKINVTPTLLYSNENKPLMKEISDYVNSITDIVKENVIKGLSVYSLKQSGTKWFWFFMNKTGLEFKYIKHPIIDTEVNTVRDADSRKASYIKKIITGIVKDFSPDIKKSKKTVNLSFEQSLNNSQKLKLKELANYIDSHHPYLETSLTTYSFNIKKSSDSYSLFWICKENKKMVFKYRITPSINSKIGTLNEDPFTNFNDVRTIIDDYCKKQRFSNDMPIEKEAKDFSEQEKIFLNKFSEFISNNFSGIYREYKPAFDSYKTNGSIYNWFWFTTQEGVLIFKYRNIPDKDEEPTVVFNADKKPFTTLERIVTSIVESQNSEHVHTKTRYVDLTKDIIRALKGKSSSSLAKPIADYVLTETINNARFDGLIKKDEEFEEYRKIGRSFRFFDYKYNIRLVNEKDAKVFFEYYLASLIYDQISLYNKKFNNQIISNKNELLQSIVSMVEDGVFDFDRCQGVTSKFLFVPESTLLDSVSKYIIQ